MALISINRDPSRRQLAVFGMAWLVFIGAAGYAVLRAGGGPTVAGAIWAAAVLVPLAGWFWPPILRWIYVAMMYATFPIGWIVSHLLLAAIYYLLVTPVGLVMRLVGYDPMTRRFDPKAESYWVPREEPEEQGRYFKQY